ncbi:signal peptidase [Candidatus Bipolaricaulota bacterium]|nr:signal peptidase [Candidatus Bipolaricaulota bacterium]
MVDEYPVGLRKTKRRKVAVEFEETQPDPEEQYIIEKDQTRELGLVLPPEMLEDEGSEEPWKAVRQATDHDILQAELNQEEADKAISKAQRLADKRSLSMNIIGAEYSFQKSQLRFYFKAPHRVDFRGLVKALARSYSTRIELEQVGPREAASILGGRGHCGQELCCRRFLYDPGPVPMDFAEKQGISVSPERITGVCGRLTCCLQYELEDYVAKLEELPEKGSEVNSPMGKGEVINRNVQKETIRIRLGKEEIEEFDAGEIEPIEGSGD